MSSVTLIINYGLTYFDKFMDMTVDSIGQCNNHVKHAVAEDHWIRRTFTAQEKVFF